ncbi:MAG: NADH:ubiquinone reductase (Na(+)-transporting) subunit D [Spirochaetota bacterium]
MALNKKVLTEPISENNPITIQILGICSALAVTSMLKPSIVMGIAVIFVITMANVIVSLIRSFIPGKIRIIVEMTVIASLVIIVDQFLKAYAYEMSKQLSVFVGLIITNCIVLGRLEAHAMSNPVPSSFLDGIGNGIGYAIILLIVGFFRELFGSGTLLGYQVIPQVLYDAGYVDNGLMVLAPGAFIILALTIWLQRIYTGYKEEE